MVNVEAAGRRAVRAVDGRVETGVGGDGFGARVEDLGDGGGERGRPSSRSVGVHEVHEVLLLERVRVVAGLRFDAPLAREVVEALLAGRAALLPAEDGGVCVTAPRTRRRFAWVSGFTQIPLVSPAGIWYSVPG